MRKAVALCLLWACHRAKVELSGTDSATGSDCRFTEWYADYDGDGFGDALSTHCGEVGGFVANADDCDDRDAAVHPDASELCDDVDNNCADGIDEATATDATAWYHDRDDDGLGDADDEPYYSCGDAVGLVANADDCDDTDPEIGAEVDGVCPEAGPDPWEPTDELLVATNISGTYQEQQLGQRVAAAGDVNGDGTLEFWVAGDGTAESSTFYGAAWLFRPPLFPEADVDDAIAVVSGDEDTNQYLGRALVAPGDLDGDGYDDVWMGAQGDDSGGMSAGAAHVFHGPMEGELYLDSAEYSLWATGPNEYLGQAVAGPGDLDGDGRPDLAVTAPRTGDWAGAVYVLLGPVSGSATTDDAAHAWQGVQANDTAGYDLCGAGDVDGDGLADLLVGARGAENDDGIGTGIAYLLLGPATSGGSLAGADARLLGEVEGDDAGSAVAGGGDLDADGYDDLLVGADGSSLGDEVAGAIYAVYGPFEGDRSLADAGAVLMGEARADHAGGTVAFLADVDGDGRDDVGVGVPWQDTGGGGRGVAYFQAGPLSGALSLADADRRYYGSESGARLGESVAGAGDLNGDGHDDILVGGTGERSPLNNYFTGAAVVILGGAF